MIKLELSESDLPELFRLGRELSGAEWLDKLGSVRLLNGNILTLDQRLAPVSTTVRLKLTRAEDGDLEIEVVRLADDGAGNFILLGLMKLLSAELVAEKTRGMVRKISDRRAVLAEADGADREVRRKNGETAVEVDRPRDLRREIEARGRRRMTRGGCARSRGARHSLVRKTLWHFPHRMLSPKEELGMVFSVPQ